MHKKKIARIMFFIFILIGFLTSLYLIKLHYDILNNTGSSFCKFGSFFDCSIVGTSRFSEIFNIPVGYLGALWFFINLLLFYNHLKNEDDKSNLLVWNIFGLLFIVYFIYAEFILKSICIFCTLTHLMVIGSFLLVIFLVKPKFNIKDCFKYKSRNDMILALVLFIVHLWIFNKVL